MISEAWDGVLTGEQFLYQPDKVKSQKTERNKKGTI
ncbi:hypothetical protein MUS1_10710 [Marinomonas ushuaiensis DSM 15871]|uniref:Uncharacterized protein n=1 Tax=Marinomonas ushuaiensis DSM 15871 TaxID=1122207 RepID=X7E8E8_9GAMM|nr:hypothetical protein MUS1_10710 [Marinomonas ushuaiensis DSM 15871]